MAEGTIGERIKKARERLNPPMTQAQLAAHLGISDKAVSAWGRNETVPKGKRLAALRIALRVNMEWLVEGTGEMENPLEAHWNSLTEAERAAVQAMIDSFLQHRRNSAA